MGNNNNNRNQAGLVFCWGEKKNNTKLSYETCKDL